MKDFIKFLRLDSLCGQLVAIAVLSLAALQCVNYYAVYSIQQSYAGEFLAVGHDYLASVCQALAHMSAAEREEYLASLDRSRGALAKPFRFRAAEAPEWETETDYYKSVLAREAVTEILTRAGIPPRDVRARVLYGDSPEASEPRFAGYVFPMMQMLVQDGGGSWLELVQPLSVTDRRLIWRQRIFIMAESLICFALVIIFIVRAMLPLKRLGESVERFGANPETASPLPERGNYEVREVARSFNKMLARVQRNLTERNNMLEAMGHDLRTPLARVQLRLDSIEPPELREKFAANIEEIRSIVEQGREHRGDTLDSRAGARARSQPAHLGEGRADGRGGLRRKRGRRHGGERRSRDVRGSRGLRRAASRRGAPDMPAPRRRKPRVQRAQVRGRR